MSKFLVVSDFDLSEVGTRFDVIEVRDNISRETGEITGCYYDVKILDGQFKKKQVTIRVDGFSREVTMDDVVNYEHIIVGFDNLSISSVQPRRGEGLRVFYKANKMTILEKVEI